jgi:hypothetical protein
MFEYLTITSAMIEQDCRKSLEKLCAFLDMPKEQINFDIEFFRSGENFNYKGFSFEGSEVNTVLLEGDCLVKYQGEFYKVPKNLTFLVIDAYPADRMENALIAIRESGQLTGDMVAVCDKGLGFEEFSEI